MQRLFSTLSGYIWPQLQPSSESFDDDEDNDQYDYDVDQSLKESDAYYSPIPEATRRSRRNVQLEKTPSAKRLQPRPPVFMDVSPQNLRFDIHEDDLEEGDEQEEEERKSSRKRSKTGPVRKKLKFDNNSHKSDDEGNKSDTQKQEKQKEKESYKIIDVPLSTTSMKLRNHNCRLPTSESIGDVEKIYDLRDGHLTRPMTANLLPRKNFTISHTDSLVELEKQAKAAASFLCNLEPLKAYAIISCTVFYKKQHIPHQFIIIRAHEKLKPNSVFDPKTANIRCMIADTNDTAIFRKNEQVYTAYALKFVKMVAQYMDTRQIVDIRDQYPKVHATAKVQAKHHCTDPGGGCSTYVDIITRSILK